MYVALKTKRIQEIDIAHAMRPQESLCACAGVAWQGLTACRLGSPRGFALITGPWPPPVCGLLPAVDS